MSKYVLKMKDTLSALNTKAQKIRADMERNSRNFDPNIAAQENAKLQEQLKSAAIGARNEIDGIHAQAKAFVKEWATPKGSDIDAKDLELLRGDFQFSEADLKALLLKHQNNGTMVNAIAKYSKEHNVPLEYVPNATDKLSVYESFAGSAQALISDIAGAIGIADNAVSITMWGQPGNISQRAEWVLYGLKAEEAPAPATHQGFNFNFKPIEGR